MGVQVSLWRLMLLKNLGAARCKTQKCLLLPSRHTTYWCISGSGGRDENIRTIHTSRRYHEVLSKLVMWSH